jgi:hypothetical protein
MSVAIVEIAENCQNIYILECLEPCSYIEIGCDLINNI